MSAPSPLRLAGRDGPAWTIESGSHVYRVVPDALECDCPAGPHFLHARKVRRPCRHLRFVLGLLELDAMPPVRTTTATREG